MEKESNQAASLPEFLDTPSTLHALGCSVPTLLKYRKNGMIAQKRERKNERAYYRTSDVIALASKLREQKEEEINRISILSA